MTKVDEQNFVLPPNKIMVIRNILAELQMPTLVSETGMAIRESNERKMSINNLPSLDISAAN